MTLSRIEPASGEQREDWLCVALFLACLAYSVAMAAVGWNHTLLDMHGFRQTQTALTTYVMLQGGPWVRYETPVLGAPWAIPLAFPLYRCLVAFLVKLCGT